MSVQIQLRRGTAANWTAANPTLSQGELGLETDTGKIKMGDGATAWASLGYFGGAPSGSAGGDLTGTYPNPTIGSAKVTYAKMQNISATNRILGRITAGAGSTEELTAANVKTILALAQADVSGLTTADSPQFAGVNVGHASDTTLTRSSAGVLAVEGKNVFAGLLTLPIVSVTMSGNVNDWAPAGWPSNILAISTGGSNRQVTGLSSSGVAAGHMLYATVSGTGGITIPRQSASSAAANQFSYPTALSPITVTAGFTALWNGTLWLIISYL